MTDKEQLAIQKAESKQRQTILAISNRVKSQFSFGNVKTWHDVYKFVGFDDAYIHKTYFPDELTKPVTIVELKDYLNDMRLSLEVSIWLKHNPPKLDETCTSSRQNATDITQYVVGA